MKHLFVPYELAVKLKEKEFREECIALYTPSGEFYAMSNISQEFSTIRNNKGKNSNIAAPLYQQVIDWFEEKHNIVIETKASPSNDKLTFIGVVINNYKLTHEGMGNLKFFTKNIQLVNGYEGYTDRYICLNDAIEEALKLI